MNDSFSKRNKLLSAVTKKSDIQSAHTYFTSNINRPISTAGGGRRSDATAAMVKYLNQSVIDEYHSAARVNDESKKNRSPSEVSKPTNIGGGDTTSLNYYRRQYTMTQDTTNNSHQRNATQVRSFNPSELIQNIQTPFNQLKSNQWSVTKRTTSISAASYG